MSLSDYTIIKLIGKGSYGEVHLVQQKKERKQYVVKKMALQKASRRERKAAELEAKLLSKLKHPNIVSYKESFESDDGNLYIIMGYAEGGDLYTRLREQRERNEHLTEVQVVRWFIQICMALQYLHQQHILHRDLKTQNIFLTKTKMIKVGDLGIARVLEGASDMATTLIGTPYYMSPELFSNRPYNHKSDVWALGCCVYEMTTLKHAFNAKDMNSLVYKILKEKMPKMPDIYSSELCDLIKNMLHHSAEKRPSVNRILRNSFIKKHIQLFLDESSRSRRPTSGKSRSSVDSASRRTSTSSVQSRCSSRESSNSVFEPASPVVEIPPGKKPRSTESSDVRRSKYTSRHATNAQKKEPTYVNIPSKNPNFAKPSKEEENVYENIPVRKHERSEVVREERLRVDSEKDCASVNNADMRQPSPVNKAIEAVVGLRISDYSNANANNRRTSPKNVDSKVGAHLQDAAKEIRIKSVDSVTSSSSEDSSKKVAISELQPKSAINQPSLPRSEIDSENFPASSDEKRSKAQGHARVSSARERRRREKQKKAQELKVSEAVKPPESAVTVMHAERLATPPEGDSKKDSISGEEVNQFYTLLHTTLKLSNQDSPPQTPPDFDSGEPASTPEEQARRNKLSPVVELSESAVSTLTEEDGPKPSAATPSKPPYSRNTPKATDIVVQVPRQQPSPTKPITQATLASTGRLMDRIVALRKECIRALGVPLLHRAYTLLDENAEEDELEKKLINLLGDERYKLWAGKIWQLKFCEESIFKHCGSITAY